MAASTDTTSCNILTAVCAANKAHKRKANPPPTELGLHFSAACSQVVRLLIVDNGGGVIAMISAPPGPSCLWRQRSPSRRCRRLCGIDRGRRRYCCPRRIPLDAPLLDERRLGAQYQDGRREVSQATPVPQRQQPARPGEYRLHTYSDDDWQLVPGSWESDNTGSVVSNNDLDNLTVGGTEAVDWFSLSWVLFSFGLS